MTIYTKIQTLPRSLPTVPASPEPGSHRWIVQVLAEMIEYSETHELEVVTAPLLTAIEQIAPSLAKAETLKTMRHASSEERADFKKGKVLDFQMRYDALRKTREI